MEITEAQETALATVRSILKNNKITAEEFMIYMSKQKVEVNEIKLNNLLENYDCGFCPLSRKNCDQENCIHNLRTYLDIEE